MKFHEKLIKLRKSNGYTQEELAEKLGVSRQAVARWEAGETTPDMKLLLGICEVFSVSADYMIHDENESNEDIPMVKEKNEEISAVNEQNRVMHLVSGICFAIAAFCGIISIVVSSHPAQLALSCFSSTVFLVLCIFQFRLYFKRKSFDNSIQNARE